MQHSMTSATIANEVSQWQPVPLRTPTEPAVEGALGGSGDAIRAALQYSSIVFGSAVIIWVVNLLAASLRGAGRLLSIEPAIVGGLSGVPSRRRATSC
jgi:uncharacterized membrane protein YtjA (UPF0391 family)